MPEVLGRLRPPRLTGAAPANPALGEMFFDNDDNTLYWWNGTTWISASGGAASGAAGGDLSGTYPNPTVAKSSANPFQIGNILIYPTTFGLLMTGPVGNQLVRNFLAGGDLHPTFRLLADGRHEWGIGGSTATDTNLYRGAAEVLRTDDSFEVLSGVADGGNLLLARPGGASGGASFIRSALDAVLRFRQGSDNELKAQLGPGGLVLGASIGTMDTNLYRYAANQLKSDDEFVSASSNAFRAVFGNYGAILRNDGNAFYILLTASGDQHGTFNALRPLSVSLATGVITFGHTAYFNGDIQTDGAAALDLASQAWESNSVLTLPRLLLPSGAVSATSPLRSRFLRNLTRDASHKRVSVCWLSSDTANWSPGTGIEFITRTDYYTGGGQTRCLVNGGAYTTNPFLRVMESSGRWPVVPKLGTVYPANFVPNPSFETDLSGWTNSNTVYETAVRQTSWAAHGSASARLTRTTPYTAGQQSDFNTPLMSLASLGLAVGDTVGIAAEINVYSAVGTPYVQARVGFYDVGGAFISSAVATVAPGGVAVTLGTRRVTGSAVIPANCTQLNVDLLAGGTGGAIDIAYDSITVSRDGVSASYIPTTYREVEVYYELTQYFGISAEIRYGAYTDVTVRPFTAPGQIFWVGTEAIQAAAPNPSSYFAGLIDVPNGLQFGQADGTLVDTNLYRSGPDSLKTDDSLTIAGAIQSQRPAGQSTALIVYAAGTANPKMRVRADVGTAFGIDFADGAGGGYDTNLYRDAADSLKTDDTLSSAADIYARVGQAAQVAIGNRGPANESGMRFGSAGDTNLYRGAADQLKTDDTFVAANIPEVHVQTDPPSPRTGVLWVDTDDPTQDLSALPFYALGLLPISAVHGALAIVEYGTAPHQCLSRFDSTIPGWVVIGQGRELGFASALSALTAATGWRKPGTTASITYPYAGVWQTRHNAVIQPTTAADLTLGMGISKSTDAATNTPTLAQQSGSAYAANARVGIVGFNEIHAVAAANDVWDMRFYSAASNALTLPGAAMYARPIRLSGLV